MDRSVSVPFRVLLTASVSESAATTIVTEYDMLLSNLGARAVAIGSAFEFFRFKRLSSKQFFTETAPVFDADATGGTGTQGQTNVEQACAFIESNAALTGTATTLDQMAQYERFDIGGPYEKLRLSIPLKVLRANALKWYNTSSTGASTDDLSPGLFVFGTRNNNSQESGWGGYVRVCIEGVVEFRGMITPALTFGAPVNPLGNKKEESDDDDLSVLSCVAKSYPKIPAAVGSAGKTEVSDGGSKKVRKSQ